MENKAKLNVLVISFFFPPYNKVGARRWAKHCKYLFKLNIPTTVITGNYNGSSPWDKDIVAFKNNIFRLQHILNLRPYYQTTLPKNFLQKIKWKISYFNWQLKKNKLSGNYNDSSINNENIYLKKAIEIIRIKNITTVILSVGPFNYSSILTNIKKQFPTIKLIIDYRDYWEDDYSNLSQQQIDTENELQKKVINSIDLILSPNAEMQNYFATTFNKKSYCLPHCFDEDDIKPITKLPVKLNYNTIKLIYGGAFYADIEENIELIKFFINRLLKTNQVSANFYVSIKGFENELSHPNIHRFDFIDSEKYFEEVKNANYAILILPPNRVNAMSSKFFELLALRKPILYFGKSGQVSEFLIQHRLGFHITRENINELVPIVLSNLITHTVPSLDYNIFTNTFEYQTKLLVDELSQL